MPSVSKKQHDAMEAAAHGGGTLGIPRKVGEEFIAHDSTEKGHAAGIIHVAPDGRVLLLRRSPTEENYASHWALPGGNGEPGETPLQTALRESREELGGDTQGKPKLVDGRITPSGMAFHTFAKPAAQAFAPRLNGEHSGHLWAHLHDLPQPLHPAVHRTLHEQLLPEGVTAQDMAPEDWRGLAQGLVKWLAAEDPEQAQDEQQRDDDGKFGSGGSNRGGAVKFGENGKSAGNLPMSKYDQDSGSVEQLTKQIEEKINKGDKGRTASIDALGAAQRGKLSATQSYLGGEGGGEAAFEEISDDKPILARTPDGVLHIVDGHHRMDDAINENKNIDALIFDVPGTGEKKKFLRQAQDDQAVLVTGPNGAVPLVAEDDKLPKSEVDYSPAKDDSDERCALCAHFQLPDACELVSGEINPEYWCKRFLEDQLGGAGAVPDDELVEEPEEEVLEDVEEGDDPRFTYSPGDLQLEDAPDDLEMDEISEEEMGLPRATINLYGDGTAEITRDEDTFAEDEGQFDEGKVKRDNDGKFATTGGGGGGAAAEPAKETKEHKPSGAIRAIMKGNGFVKVKGGLGYFNAASGVLIKIHADPKNAVASHVWSAEHKGSEAKGTGAGQLSAHLQTLINTASQPAQSTLTPEQNKKVDEALAQPAPATEQSKSAGVPTLKIDGLLKDKGYEYMQNPEVGKMLYKSDKGFVQVTPGSNDWVVQSPGFSTKEGSGLDNLQALLGGKKMDYKGDGSSAWKVSQKNVAPQTPAQQAVKSKQTEMQQLSSKASGLRETIAKARPTPTAGENSALNAYKGSEYVAINQKLRFDHNMGSVQHHINALDSYLSKAEIPEDCTLWRNVNNDYAKILQSMAMEGMKFTDKGFISTSTDPNFHLHSGLKMKINVKKGTKGAAIRPSGTSDGENEVVLQRGSALVIKKLDFANNIMEVDVDQSHFQQAEKKEAA